MQLFTAEFKAEIEKRLCALQRNMAELQISAMLINATVNIYYLTGKIFRGYIYVALNQTPIWFVVKPTIFAENPDVIFIRKPELIRNVLKERGYELPRSLGLELDDLSYSEVVRLQNIFPNAQIANASYVLRLTRMIKTDWEIEQMTEDGKHHSHVYSKVKDCYKSGMTDLQFQIEIERQLRLEGSLGISRIAGNLMEINLGSVISGDNADTPGPYEFTMTGEGVDPSLPVGANNSAIAEGTTVMIDMNGGFNGYQTDMTRVWALGYIPHSAREAHECSLYILRELEKLGKPGIPVPELYNKAIKIVEQWQLQEYFMGHKNKVNFIGHGVGIELNEMPVINSRSNIILKENMTIALEPKFVIPSVGAVGCENTYLVTSEGLKNLTVFPEQIELL